MTESTRRRFAAVAIAIFVPAGVIGIYGGMTGDDRFIAMGGLFAFGLGGLLTIPQWGPMWRGEPHQAELESPPTWWPYSLALWQGWVRSRFLYGVLACPMFAILSLMIGIRYADWPLSPSELGSWYAPLTALSLLFFFLVNALGLSIIAVNRPQWAVPPSMRDQYGWFAHLDAQRPTR